VWQLTQSPLLREYALTGASDEQGEAYIFSDRLQKSIIYDPDEQLARKGVTTRSPDRVFGLRQTALFKQHTTSGPKRRHSPFKDGQGLYPFLIIEAKPEKGSPGFESVEAQTAFPIRALVKLQQELSSAQGLYVIQPRPWRSYNWTSNIIY
jgi:hypothetical protein